MNEGDFFLGTNIFSFFSFLFEKIDTQGGVLVRMRVYDTTFCVVCSHLSSGESPGVESKRNSEYHEILKRSSFTTPKAGLLHQPMPASALDHE